MRLHRACDAGESHESGAAVVEFALVVPLLLVILLGMLDFGKAFNYWINETQLSSSGARWAAVNSWPGKGATDGALQLANYIQGQALRNGGTSATKAQVCISFPTNPATGTAGHVSDAVTVSVSTSYRWLSLLSSQKFAKLPTGTALNADATMRLEVPWTSTSTVCST
jgi:Flp pilus assembly protein TadG